MVSSVARGKKNLTWTQSAGQPARFRSDGKRTVMSLSAEDINVVFQPIVDLATGQQFAMEALVRCKVPEYKSPGDLFARAEMESACGRLGRVIREVAFDRGAGKVLFVNIHPDELSSRWLVRPDDPLCFHDAPLYLEITESATFEHYDLCVNVLKEVCSRTGAHMVIDDLGAGYSNLKRMLDLHPEIVKLDLTLARGLDKHPRQRTLVSQLVGLCSDLGAKVVIEGVETLEELKAARDTGAEFAQGFLLAMPSYPPPKVVWPL
jgi:EAL domain-containing protein (putative c-di-GMP-specific phosphodiesterase class I)